VWQLLQVKGIRPARRLSVDGGATLLRESSSTRMRICLDECRGEPWLSGGHVCGRALTACRTPLKGSLGQVRFGLLKVGFRRQVALATKPNSCGAPVYW